MSVLGWLFTKHDPREEETQAALDEIRSAQRQNLQIVQSAARVTKRRSEVMHTMAGAMQMMARGDNEDS